MQVLHSCHKTTHDHSQATASQPFGQPKHGMSETHHTHGCIGIAWAGTAWAGIAWAGIAWAGTGMAPPIACAGTVTADTGRGVPSTMVCACIPASNCTGCA